MSEPISILDDLEQVKQQLEFLFVVSVALMEQHDNSSWVCGYQQMTWVVLEKLKKIQDTMEGINEG